MPVELCKEVKVSPSIHIATSEHHSIYTYGFIGLCLLQVTNGNTDFRFPLA